MKSSRAPFNFPTSEGCYTVEASMSPILTSKGESNIEETSHSISRVAVVSFRVSKSNKKTEAQQHVSSSRRKNEWMFVADFSGSSQA